MTAGLNLHIKNGKPKLAHLDSMFHMSFLLILGERCIKVSTMNVLKTRCFSRAEQWPILIRLSMWCADWTAILKIDQDYEWMLTQVSNTIMTQSCWSWIGSESAWVWEAWEYMEECSNGLGIWVMIKGVLSIEILYIPAVI